MTDELRETIIARTLGLQNKPKEETTDAVEKETTRMGVVAKTMDTARELSGANVLEEELGRKDKKLAATEKERDQATEDKHKAELQTVKTELGAKIDDLAKAYAGGASKQTVADQISDIKKAADQLNLGGSRISEIKDMMTLIESLNPRKNLTDQIKDAKELISVFQPPEDKGKDFTIVGMPATVALELKKMDTNLQITLENMKDERQRRDQEFTLKERQYDEERAARLQEVQGKIQVEKERNKMLGGAIETVGRAIGRGAAEAGRQAAKSPGSVGEQAQEQPRSYHIELNEGEKFDFDCPLCQTRIAVGPDSTVAQCVGCDAKYPIVRKPAASMAEPVPPEEE